MSDLKQHMRSEVRSDLKPSKARLFRDDGSTEIIYVGLDLSTQGLGILIRGDAAAGETLRLVADRIGEITLQVVWSRKDLVRQSYSHVGMRSADSSIDLRGFFAKVFVAEEVEPAPTQTAAPAHKLSEDVVRIALQALNTDDPSLFRKANLSHLEKGARAFPFVHEGEHFAVIVPSSSNRNMLRKATIEQAGQHIQIFHLEKLSDAVNSYRAKLAWPEFSASGCGPVLLVEDDEDLLELMKVFLEKNGFSILTAQDGNTALSLIKRHPEVSAIITDIKMPGMDGIALIQAATTDLQGRGGCPPFIIVSGYVTPELLKDGKRLGVSHWFVKPVETSDLLNALGSLLTTKVA